MHRIDLAVLVVIVSIAINLLFRIRCTAKLLETVVNDTLKTDGKFSGTKLTMFFAMASVLWAFHYITIKDGFNDTAFITMACIATGVSITKAWSKKLDPEVTPPKTEKDEGA